MKDRLPGFEFFEDVRHHPFLTAADPQTLANHTPGHHWLRRIIIKLHRERKHQRV